MTIYRDGKAIELIREELEAAYNEYDNIQYEEQIKQVFKDMNLGIAEEDLDIDEIMYRIDNELGENDTYWDIYHCTIEDIIYAYIAELEELKK